MSTHIPSRPSSINEEFQGESAIAGPSSRPHVAVTKGTASSRPSSSIADITQRSPLLQYRGPGSRSGTRQKPTKRPFSELDNWQTLQELVGDEKLGDDQVSKQPRSTPDARVKHYNLLSLFNKADKQDETSSRSTYTQTYRGDENGGMPMPLSASPPQMGYGDRMIGHGSGDLGEEDSAELSSTKGDVREDGNENTMDRATVPLIVEHSRTIRNSVSEEPGTQCINMPDHHTVFRLSLALCRSSALLASISRRYRHTEMLARLLDRIPLHVPSCSGSHPVDILRNRLTWPGHPQASLFSSYGRYRRCLCESLSAFALVGLTLTLSSILLRPSEICS